MIFHAYCVIGLRLQLVKSSLRISKPCPSLFFSSLSYIHTKPAFILDR